MDNNDLRNNDSNPALKDAFLRAGMAPIDGQNLQNVISTAEKIQGRVYYTKEGLQALTKKEAAKVEHAVVVPLSVLRDLESKSKIHGLVSTATPLAEEKKFSFSFIMGLPPFKSIKQTINEKKQAFSQRNLIDERKAFADKAREVNMAAQYVEARKAYFNKHTAIVTFANNGNRLMEKFNPEGLPAFEKLKDEVRVIDQEMRGMIKESNLSLAEKLESTGKRHSKQVNAPSEKLEKELEKAKQNALDRVYYSFKIFIENKDNTFSDEDIAKLIEFKDEVDMQIIQKFDTLKKYTGTDTKFAQNKSPDEIRDEIKELITDLEKLVAPRMFLTQLFKINNMPLP